MPKNTFILVALLAVVAAIITGVNLMKPKEALKEPARAAPIIPPPSQGTPSAQQKQAPGTAFESTTCGVAFSSPETHEKFGDPTTNGVFFVNASDQNDATYIGCLKSVPRPTVTPDKIEKITVASVSGTLYHDASEKSGKPVNKLIFTHPKNGLEVLIVGYGSGFDQIVSSLTIL